MAEDLFHQMDTLFRNKTPEGAVHVFVLHRFLASDPTFAPVAKEFSQIWDDSMVVEMWRTCLPRSTKAPRLRYPAPKKLAASSELVTKLAAIENCTLLEAEEAVLMFDQMKLHTAALTYYGIEEEKKKK